MELLRSCNRLFTTVSASATGNTFSFVPSNFTIEMHVGNGTGKGRCDSLCYWRLIEKPTEQAQKGCDPVVHPPEEPVPGKKARIFLAGISQVKLPKPIGKQSVLALKYDGISAKKERKKGRSSIHPPTATACLKSLSTLSIFSPSSMEKGRALLSANSSPSEASWA